MTSLDLLINIQILLDTDLKCVSVLMEVPVLLRISLLC